jgi:hypothetical protein
LAWLDHGPKPFWQDAPPTYQFPFGGFVPFSLATPHQAPAEALATMMKPFGLFGGGFTSAFFDRTVFGLDKLLLDGGGGTTLGHPTSDA